MRYLIAISIIILLVSPTSGETELVTGFSEVFDLVYDPDSGQIIGSGLSITPWQENVIVWDFQAGSYEPVFSFKSEDHADFSSIDYMNNSAVAANNLGEIYRFERQNGQWIEQGRIVQREMGFICVKIVNGSTILAADQYNITKYVDGEPVDQLETGIENFERTRLIEIVDLDHIYTQTFNGELRLWNFTAGNYQLMAERLQSFSARENQFAIGYDRNITLIDGKNVQQIIRPIESEVTYIDDLALSPEGLHLSIVSNYQLELYNSSSYHLFTLNESSGIDRIEMSEWMNSTHLMIGTQHGDIFVLNILSGAIFESNFYYDSQPGLVYGDPPSWQDMVVIFMIPVAVILAVALNLFNRDPKRKEKIKSVIDQRRKNAGMLYPKDENN